MQQPQYVRYKPNDKAPGRNDQIQERVVRIVEQQKDPFAPSTFRNKKILAAPGSPPAPILRSPPRKLTKEDQQTWKIPPCISNWKNAKGYVVPLDKRIGADGRGLQDVTVSERFGSLAEDLYLAEKKAREEIKIRGDLTKQQKARVEEQREQELRALAQQARQARSGGGVKSEEESIHERARREMMRETLREHRMAKAGKNARDRDEDRDISEAVALGKQVQPTIKGEDVYDARLFNTEGGGMQSGFGGEDANAAFDASLFTDRTKAAGYKYDAQRVGAARQEMDDADEAKRKRPMIGQSNGSNKLEFVTDAGDEDDDPFKLDRFLTFKKNRNE